jgi:hypothetical protein
LPDLMPAHQPDRLTGKRASTDESFNNAMSEL